MNNSQVVRAINARTDRNLTAKLSADGASITVLDDKGNNIPWMPFVIGKSGQISDTCATNLHSYHPPKIAGQNEHQTVVIFGDLYLANTGKPSLADKAVTALLATPVVPVPSVSDPFAEVPGFVGPKLPTTDEAVENFLATQ